jgi:hypothetical protein
VYEKSTPMLMVLRVLNAWIKSLDPDLEDVTQLRLLAPDLPLEVASG